jgi:2-polyprenyl-6-hydroxyphenyl methylase/3-demethylubiquinone-9 3-methyltransferase
MLTSTHEAVVASRFDLLEGRFKRSLDRDDYRLRGILRALGPVGGLRILDMGCGKGRFARALENLGARVVGIDLSAAMLSEATSVDRVRATARRLPFHEGLFDAVIAVEVLEHIDPRFRHATIAESRRVLRPGGTFVVVDKNLASLNALRPWLPAIVVKWIDEYRGRWMYDRGGPVRERWFWPRRLRAELRRLFDTVRIVHLASPLETSCCVFRFVPAARLMTLWVARCPGGRDV